MRSIALIIVLTSRDWLAPSVFGVFDVSCAISVATLTLLKMTVRNLLLVPHAGEAFAGAARLHAFSSYLESTSGVGPKEIIFVGTVHDLSQESKVWIDGVEADPLGDEHSFALVKDEIYDQMHPERVLVVMPTTVQAVETIVRSLTPIPDGVCVICSSDLTHYGPAYGNTAFRGLAFPQARVKEREEPLLEALVRGDPEAVKACTSHTPDICCGPLALLACSTIAGLNGQRGRVEDYYDSLHAQSDGIVRYCCEKSLPESSSFVSYLSMSFAKESGTATAAATPLLEKCLALGSCASVIAGRCAISADDAQVLAAPSWTDLANEENGAFAGTQAKGNSRERSVTCCVGKFQTKGVPLSLNIINAAVGCCADTDRWHEPYDYPRLFETQSFNVTVLQQEPWVSMSVAEFEADYKASAHLGVFLTLSDGGTATFLPSVRRHSFPFGTPVQTYLSALAEKAGATDGKYMGAEIRVYRALEFSSNDRDVVAFTAI